MSASNFFKEYFSFTKSERKGIIFLLILIFLSVISYFFIDFFKKDFSLNFSSFENEINDYEKNNNLLPQLKKADSLFAFDPNTIDSVGLSSLGFSSKQIKTLINFREKFNGFKKKEDLLKVYGIDSGIYLKLEPWINIADTGFVNSQYINTPSGEKSELFNFDPNTLSREGWLRLGLSEKQINSIFNYINKGGKFNKKEDLKKMYTISEELYTRIEPFIQIQSQLIKEKSFSNPVDVIELNTADSLTLLTLNGIGPSYCKRILKYRAFLGGFFDKKQLFEVYGMTQELYNKIEKNITIDPEAVSKININEATVKQLNAHPYIDFQLAKTLVDIREFNGKYSNLEDLLKFKILTAEQFDKLKWYLTVK